MLDRDSTLPLYHQLNTILGAEVARLKAGEPFISENAIVARFGVSRFTASRALNHLVRAGRLYRIQGKGSFASGPASAAPGGKRILFLLGRSLTEAVAARDYVWAEQAQGVVDGVGNAAQLILCLVPQNVDQGAFVIERIADPAVDGVILFHWAKLDEMMRAVISLQKPFALLNVKGARFAGRNTVLVDEAAGARSATEHLIGLGHRRILFMGYSEPADLRGQPSQSRLAGYRQAMSQHRLRQDPHPIICEKRDIPQAVARLGELLDTQTPPTAVFAAHDPTACAVMELLRRRGLRVPEDVSVVGYDDCPDAARSTPPLTTVHKPRQEMGQAAARLVMDQILKGFSRSGECLLAPVLAVRGSTAKRAYPRSIDLANYASQVT